MALPRQFQEIGGVVHYRCADCKDWLPEALFYHRKISKPKVSSYCKLCTVVRVNMRNREDKAAAVRAQQQTLGNLDAPRFLAGHGDRFDDCTHYKACLDSASRQRETHSHCCGGAAGEPTCKWYAKGAPDLIQIWRGADMSNYPDTRGL